MKLNYGWPCLERNSGWPVVGIKDKVMGKKVLVVEDHHDTSFLLCRLLKMEGYEVEHAIDGVVGLNAAATEHPDLIVTDLQMPRMDGIELIKQIRKSNPIKGIPIIVMSAYGQRRISDAIEAGADAFVEKPINLDTFLETVKSKLAAA
jgi:two-component system, chemotaxis family, sensor histidine kinase and response regulator WspE